MNLLYDQPVVGGAVLMSKEKYILAGMENEKYYGWGNDDYDRYYRFLNMGCNISQEKVPLLHLAHPRGVNSRYGSELRANLSLNEFFKMKNGYLIKIKPEAEKDIE